MRQDSKKLRQAKEITEFLRATKTLRTRSVIAEALKIERRAWCEAIEVAKSRGWVGTYGAKKGLVFCHADYKESLKGEYETLVFEREKAYAESRSDYFRDWRKKSKAKKTEAADVVVKDCLTWSDFAKRKIRFC